jgi:hypothetical protein
MIAQRRSTSVFSMADRCSMSMAHCPEDYFLLHQSKMPDAPTRVERFLLLHIQAVIKGLKLGLDCLQTGKLVSAIFSANAIRPGVVGRSVLSAHSDVFAEASADTEASLKSFSAAFWRSVRLSRFARRSVLAAGVALLLQIALIILVSSHVP